MNKYRITNPNNNSVRDCKSRTTKNDSHGGNEMDVLTEELFHCKQIYDEAWKFVGMDRNTKLDLEIKAKEFTSKISKGYNKYFKTIGGVYVPTQMYIMSGKTNFGVDKKNYLKNDIRTELPAYSKDPTYNFRATPDRPYSHIGSY